MKPPVIKSIAYAELPTLVGVDLPCSAWRPVEQEDIDLFAEATGDRQWIHVDVARAEREMGGTIAHGFLLLALLPVLSNETLEFAKVTRRINYGFERVRFTGMVRPRNRVRLTHRATKVEAKSTGTLFTRDCRLEIEGSSRPALTAEWTILLQP